MNIRNGHGQSVAPLAVLIRREFLFAAVSGHFGEIKAGDPIFQTLSTYSVITARSFGFAESPAESAPN
jgi:hypothetical protein